MKVETILTEVRHKLSDAGKERWSDDRLINLLNRGLTDIALKTDTFNRQFYLKLSDNENKYDLSDKILRIDRVQYQTEEALPLRTLREMDRLEPMWETKYGDKIKNIIYDKQDSARITVYPIPQNTKNFNISSNQVWGITTAIYTSEVKPILTEVYGDLDPVELTGFLVVYGSKRQPLYTSVDDDIDATRTIKNALEFYITGQAFADNTDSISLEKSKYNLSNYADNIDTLQGHVTDNSIEAVARVEYNGMGL